jgi:hypothetical protein
MLDSFFSCLCLAYPASVSLLHRPLPVMTNAKVIKKEDTHSLETLRTSAASAAPFCTHPIRQIGSVVFRHKLFRKRCSFRFKSGFRPSNQPARNVTSVTSVTTKTVFSQNFAETTFDVSLQEERRQFVKECTKCTKCTIQNHFFTHFPSLDVGCAGSTTAFFKKVPVAWTAITCFTRKNLQHPCSTKQKLLTILYTVVYTGIHNLQILMLGLYKANRNLRGRGSISFSPGIRDGCNQANQGGIRP